MKSIYLDYASSTPLAQEVIEAMVHVISNDNFGNPSSIDHEYGKHAHDVVEACRLDVAHLINADQREIIWTSGATEANNLAIFGSYEFNLKNKSGNIITSMTEHKSVIEPFKTLEKKGLRVLFLSPKKNGEIDLNELEKGDEVDIYFNIKLNDEKIELFKVFCNFNLQINIKLRSSVNLSQYPVRL